MRLRLLQSTPEMYSTAPCSSSSGAPAPQGLSSCGLRLSLTRVEVMSIMTSWKAAVSSACRWVCSAIFSLNFRGLEEPDPEPELGPAPGPQPEPIADILVE
ncbi:hypothetical protein EYF80_065049 [Liparis tanakae]|uniref:Uncharacterized protein n=1 Tax=Liparis tanakae TaxID=230148 RepID=A0A4Z2E7T6_9TELE|nr:hypothetical protein EYF80_065049 [Liparis tanakae]